MKNSISIVSPSGMFNTGTNPFAMYIQSNCKMPHNTHDVHGGMRWQVPWGKHTLASRKWNQTAGHNEEVNKTNVLPVAIVRDPYFWMQSLVGCNIWNVNIADRFSAYLITTTFLFRPVNSPKSAPIRMLRNGHTVQNTVRILFPMPKTLPCQNLPSPPIRFQPPSSTNLM